MGTVELMLGAGMRLTTVGGQLVVRIDPEAVASVSDEQLRAVIDWHEKSAAALRLEVDRRELEHPFKKLANLQPFAEGDGE